MNVGKLAKAGWFDAVTPFAFGLPMFDGAMILTMVLVKIESSAMLLWLSGINGKKAGQPALAVGALDLFSSRTRGDAMGAIEAARTAEAQ